MATGDEVVAPGRPLPPGKLYASNLATLDAWCRRYRMTTETVITSDEPAEIRAVLETVLDRADALLTSGGAWTGDRDRVAAILTELGWEQVFHRIRIGPGKAVGFGMLTGKPVFILPGGPPSNLIGFLEIALPGLMRLSGNRNLGLPKSTVRLTTELVGADADWTQFIFGRIEEHDDHPLFVPLQGASRLGSMAGAEAIVAIPEGSTHLPAGSLVQAQLLG
jgi:molybdopterin molybdotransferase